LSLLHFLQAPPAFGRHAHGELEGADGASVNRVADAAHFGGAVVGHAFLDEAVEAAELAAAATQDDVQKHARLNFRVQAADDLVQTPDNRLNDGPAGVAERHGYVELRRLAAHGKRDDGLIVG